VISLRDTAASSATPHALVPGSVAAPPRRLHACLRSLEGRGNEAGHADILQVQFDCTPVKLKSRDLRAVQARSELLIRFGVPDGRILNQIASARAVLISLGADSRLITGRM